MSFRAAFCEVRECGERQITRDEERDRGVGKDRPKHGRRKGRGGGRGLLEGSSVKRRNVRNVKSETRCHWADTSAVGCERWDPKLKA